MSYSNLSATYNCDINPIRAFVFCLHRKTPIFSVWYILTKTKKPVTVLFNFTENKFIDDNFL